MFWFSYYHIILFACTKSRQGYRDHLYGRSCTCLKHTVPTTSAGPEICSARQQYVHQADYIEIRVLILWPIPHSISHPLLSCSKHFPCHVRGAQEYLTSAYEHYTNCNNHAYIIAHINTGFLDCIMWGLRAWPHHFHDQLYIKRLRCAWQAQHAMHRPSVLHVL
jgi:hypothetical protein